jgi:hypothetical protein
MTTQSRLSPRPLLLSLNLNEGNKQASEKKKIQFTSETNNKTKSHLHETNNKMIPTQKISGLSVPATKIKGGGGGKTDSDVRLKYYATITYMKYKQFTPVTQSALHLLTSLQ